MAASVEAPKSLEFGAWEQLKIGGTLPSTRYSQATALLDKTAYVFGGASSGVNDATTYHGDLFALNFESLPLKWEVIEQKGDVPSGREGATFNAVGDKLYLYGGVDKEAELTCVEGLFVFTPASHTWERLNTTGPVPRAQSLSALVYENKLITFGGILQGKAQNHLHSLDLTTLEWSEIKSTGTIPPPRCDHSAVMVGNRMIVTSGSGSDDLWFNDIHSLSLTSSHWSKLEPKSRVGPSPRDYSTINCIANTYLLQYGGFSGTNGEDECFSDLYFMDMSTNSVQWKPVKAAGDIPARYAHSTILYKNKLYVFAGQNTEEEFNDIWSISIQVPIIEFEPTPVPRVHYTTSTPIPAPRKVITPSPPKVPTPRDFEKFHDNYMKKINEMFDTLVDQFQQLDKATATLKSERSAFEAEKKAHYELYERQQQELDEMLKDHQEQNNTWVSRIREELDNDKWVLAQEKAALESASLELAKEKEAFQQKSKKLDAIMHQVQGLKD